MAKKKKSEIDAILEQLKNSYFDDSRDMDEELTEDSYESEEDAELAAVLEKIFTESEDIYSSQSNTKEMEISEEPESIEEPTQDPEHQEIDNAQEEVSTAQHEPDTTELIADSVEEKLSEADDIKTEEERVDDVLKSMFHFDSPAAEEPAIVEVEETPERSLPEVIEGSVCTVVEEDIIEEDIVEEDIVEEDIVEEEVVDEQLPTIIDEEPEFEKAIENEADIDASNEQDIPEAEYTVEETPISDEILDDDIQPEIYEPVYIPPKKKIITDPNEYVEDIMQYSLSGISFFKPQKDIDFSTLEPALKAGDTIEKSEPTETQEPSETKSDITDKEIALLMKLGYSGEINASGENEHAHKVIFDESKEYVPEKHKILHGFTGKEFSSRKQVPAIQRKFKQDRLVIMIQAIIVSVLALAAIITDFIASFSYVKYESLAITCLISSFIALAVMSKQVFAGISAIFKFDTNQYSLPSIILVESLICNLIVGLISSLGTSPMSRGSYYSVSGYAILYMAIAAWSEWVDCYKESGVFDFIAQNNKMYVAEKRTSADVVYNEGKRRHPSMSDELDGRYIVKQAKFISGFHKKIGDKTSRSRIFMMIGIIPAIAIITGMIITIINDSLISGVSGMSFILFLSAPLLNVASLSVIELLNYFRLKESNSVIIGSDATHSVSEINSLVFKDKDVIDVVACTPINPNKNAENPKKWLNIATRVFETLGGPLSDAEAINKATLSNIDNDIAINSISDNGIDIYFDSSMNILIGDRAYMQSHGIKVKTDVNLTGATRGADRSVIYMAFDKVPQLGFIVTCKVKKSFLKIISLLSGSDINIEVKSYEPEINEYFFENNIPDCPITTVKPVNYENMDASDVSDCEIASSNPLDICRSIVYSKIMAKDIAKNTKQSKIQSIIGFVSALALGILICLPSNIDFIRALQEYTSILFYIAAIAIVIPNIVHIVKVFKRK